MAEVKAKDLDLGEHEVGYEWKAGETPPGDSTPGQWIVKKYSDCWVVLFHSLPGAEYVIQTFSPTLKGERAAKVMAIKLVDVSWGREPQTL